VYRIAIAYLWAGALFSAVMEFSYVYAAWFVVWHMGWEIFSAPGLLALTIIGSQAVVEPLFRLPALAAGLLWWCWAGEGSFWRWLGPGFFVSHGAG